MKNDIYKYFADDHRRLEELLNRSFPGSDGIDEESYSDFRSGLLKHIALEEKILFPSILKFQNGKQHKYAAQLRLEHGAFAALLVHSPAKLINQVFLAIIPNHNKLEEGADGIYLACDTLPGEWINEMFLKINEYPAVPAMPYNDSQLAGNALRRAVERAGYNFDQIIGTQI